MRRNNKGFTLVELLAVIVIMGILMMIAIPSVTRTIENSRKDTFIDIAKSYGNAARTLWTSDNLTCDGVVSSAVDDGDYYILINSKEGAKESLPVLVDQGGKSSWGNRDVNGYVRVNISTTPGEDTDGDGELDIEPKRLTKFYVSLSDGTHGILDDDTSTMDELVRGNIVMTLTPEQIKKIEFTLDDGKLNCSRNASGKYSCTNVTPIKNMTGVCVDDNTTVATIPSGPEEDLTYEVLNKETGEITTPTETFNTYAYDIYSGESDYSGSDGDTYTNYNANEYYVSINNLPVPIREIIDEKFYTHHNEIYSVNKLGRNLINVTAGELSKYSVSLIFPSGNKTIVDYSIGVFELAPGQSLNIPSVTYHYYNENGILDSSSPAIPIWLYDESTKTFTVATEETIIRENMKIYIDMSGVLSYTVLDALES